MVYYGVVNRLRKPENALEDRMAARVLTGAEVFLRDIPEWARGKAIGFVTNQTGLTRDLKPLAQEFLSAGLNVRALFGPEHGIRGEVADGVQIASGVDNETGLPVYSLYGQTKKPTAEMMEGLELFIFDIQDVGARFYTFLWTMAGCLEAAVEAGIPFAVLDRPAVLGGNAVEGPLLELEFSSLVGLYPVTNRFGLTMGEVARLVAATLDEGPSLLRVVQMEGWKRSLWFDECGLQWVMPSPNMPTLDTAIVYPGFCMFEGTNISEGRGTTRPFEMIGAEWIEATQLAGAMNELGLPGVLFRPVYFVPWFSKFKDTPCQGVQAHVTDRAAFRPVRSALELLVKVKELYPDKFKFREPGSTGKSFFDLLMGSDMVRKMVMDGVSAEDIEKSWSQGLQRFSREREAFFLYD